MANIGRYIDRSPNVIAAGRKNPVSELSPCLSYFSLEDEVDATLGSLPKPPRKEFGQRPSKTSAHTGYYTQIKSLLSPPRRRTFQHLRDELTETAYKSYWTNELGKVPDQVPGLPFGMDPETTIFGKPSCANDKKEDNDTVQTVVFPKRPFGEARLEEELGLELYQKSHSHYLVGQKKDLSYEVPHHVIYGKSDYVDRTGRLVKKSMQWFMQDELTRSSERQARHRDMWHYEMGLPRTPNKIAEIVGPDHVFGISTSFDDTGVREGTRYGPVDKGKQINGEYVNFLCNIRKSIKKKNPPFPFFDLVTNLKLLDEGGCGCLPLTLVYQVCERLGLNFDKEILEMILRHLGVLHGEKNDTVSYHGFCNLLDYRKPLPEFKKVDDLPDDLKFYESTYQAQNKDLKKKEEYAVVKRAGVPMLRTDRSAPGDAGCRGDRFLLVDETSVDACVRPSIFTYYGLTHRDFLQLRTKDYMKDLWKRVGLEIPDDFFEEMWKEGLKREENDGEMVCIETFRSMLDEMCAAKLAEVRDA